MGWIFFILNVGISPPDCNGFVYLGLQVDSLTSCFGSTLLSNFLSLLHSFISLIHQYECFHTRLALLVVGFSEFRSVPQPVGFP